MKKFSIKDLAQIIKAHEPQVTSHERRFFTGVSIDSRTIKAGDCFFAVKGENFDGHDYIDQAFANHATCAVVSKDIVHAGILKVDDTVKALGTLAAHYRNACSFKVIAITGSVGKTTTRQITYHVLSKHFRTFAAPKNFNNSIGLPLTLLTAEPETEIVIAELGSSSPGEIAYLTDIAAPDIAVVTKICPAHLDGFGDLQTIREEKLSIAQGLRPGGVFITDAASKIKPENVTYKGSASYFSLDAVDITLPLLGQGNIDNAITAFSICSRFGITANQFADDVKTLPAVPMRTELLKFGTLTVLNDCYNANPDSMKNALQILSHLDQGEKRRKVFICGDMAELGTDTNALHEQLGMDIADNNIQLLLTVGNLAKIAAESAGKVTKQSLQNCCFKNALLICEHLSEFIKQNDIILVKGSRSCGLEPVIEKLRILFS